MSPETGSHLRTELRVLFFEDDYDDIALEERALSLANFEVIADVAVNLEQFRNQVRSKNYDVILADYRMPGNTGMDCFEQLKAEGLNTPFILVTGSLGEETAVECLKEGVADYVLKDGLVRLPVAVRRALDEQRLRENEKLAQEALRRSEASYRSLIENAPCGILRADAKEGHLLEANIALAQMLGYPSAQELLSESALGGVAIGHDLIRKFIGSLNEDCRMVSSDLEWKHKDGSVVVVSLRGRLLRDPRGAPLCFEMVADNLTERRRAEERIEHLNRLYSVLSLAGQAIVRLKDREKLLEEICRVVVEQGRYQMAWVGLIGSDQKTVNPVASWGDENKYHQALHVTIGDEPAGRGPVGTAIRQGRHSVSNDLLTDPCIEPWRERARESSYRSVGAFPLVVGGCAIGAIVIYAATQGLFDHEHVALLDKLAANVSFALEARLAEEIHNRVADELNQFFGLSLDLLSISDRLGYIHRMNPAWQKTLGFSAEELRSRPWTEFVHPEDRPSARAAQAGFASGQAVENLELRFIAKDGSNRWLMVSAIPGSEGGTVFAAVTDITQRKQLEDRLRRQNLELEEQNRRMEAASRMKSAFLANMSHELRSPLNGIIGFTELLYDGKLGEIGAKPKEFLNRIHKSAKHLLELINGVLDLSKVEAGRIELRTERVRLSPIIKEVIGVLSAFAADKRIAIDTVLDPEVDQVITDPARFRQILYNYLSNALKFTGDQGKITVRLLPEGSETFRLEVSDSGIGIPEKEIPRLFVEFQQLDSSFAKRYQGTGLGLALTKRIVEAQGGRVGVESSVGKGSTFFAVLPRIGQPATSLIKPIAALELSGVSTRRVG